MHGRHILGLTNIEELEEWLSHVGDDIQASLITRKALRSLPFIIDITDNGINDEATLLALRATLLGAVHCTSHDLLVATLHTVHDKAKSFASNVAKENQNAAAALRNSSDAAYAHTPLFNKEEAFFAIISESHPEETLRDTQCISQGIENAPFSTTLWATNSPSHSHNLAKDKFEHSKDRLAHEWSFWIDWYQGFLDGKPLDWELQRRVALIADPIWEEGPEAVAQEIERIRADWLAEQLPQADKVSFDHETGLFEATPIALKADELVETILNQVEFARSVAANSNCGFNSSSTAWLYIDHTLENCRNDPNAIEQNFEIARNDILEGLTNQTYFEDAKLSALEQVLDRAVTDLRANHPDVAEAWETRIKHKLRVAKADQKQVVVEEATKLIAVSSEKMGKELALDAKTIAESSGEVQGGAIRRFFGRVAQMRIIMHSHDVIMRIDSSTAYKGTSILLALQSLINMITKIWPG